VPGGGLKQDGSLPDWTRSRLDRVLKIGASTNWIGLLSGGTVHKPPPLDPAGYPLFESRQAAAYLSARGINPARLLTEICSYDTIGNAYYSRLLFAEPFGFKKLHIVTSAFHLPRTEAIFKWIYSLTPVRLDYSLTFESVPDTGLAPDDLQARRLRESHSLEKLQGKIKSITSLNVFHNWLYSEHNAYSTDQKRERLSENELGSY
jgi:hypothetical protein